MTIEECKRLKISCECKTCKMMKESARMGLDIYSAILAHEIITFQKEKGITYEDE